MEPEMDSQMGLPFTVLRMLYPCTPVVTRKLRLLSYLSIFVPRSAVMSFEVGICGFKYSEGAQNVRLLRIEKRLVS